MIETAGGQAGGSLRGAEQQGASPIALSHVADFTRRYPGEMVSFYTRVRMRAAAPGPGARASLPTLQTQVRVALSAGLILDTYEVLVGPDDMPWITVDDGANNLIWRVDLPPQARATGDDWLEYRVQARVAPGQDDRLLTSRAIVTAALPVHAQSPQNHAAETLYVEETATIAVAARGRYLRYLPALYRDDELMGRLLMLFESFYGPIEQHIGCLDLYFDPQFTPPEVLPWLASWLDLVLDERWPEARRRALLRAAAKLYRRRGTRRGLEEYLEIYTGVRPRIVEHRAHNLQLGPEARLGQGVALGRANLPHTFTVTLCLSPDHLLRPQDAGSRPAPGGEDVDEAERRLVRRIRAIIDAEKPAHTHYTVRLERTIAETRAGYAPPPKEERNDDD